MPSSTANVAFLVPQGLAPWDVLHFTRILRQNKCEVSANALAPYFSLGAVMEGLSGLLHNLYDVTLQVEEPTPGELWATDVYKLAGVSISDASLPPAASL